ncbi:MAG TPA: Uma2 family endonuclease [Pyrinomonadaceae bacterium]|jgi:Uma2 family endonuclease
MSLAINRHFFTVAEFERMGEAGILSQDARFELIEGEIIEISPIGSRHAACVKSLNKFLNRTVGDIAIVSIQDPIRLSDFSEPQPDVTLLRLRDDFYRNAHPRAEDVLLVIEVADTTLETDRQIKLPLYASAGVAEVWIVNLVDEQIETYAGLSGGAYQSVGRYGRGERVQSQNISQLVVDAADVLG